MNEMLWLSTRLKWEAGQKYSEAKGRPQARAKMMLKCVEHILNAADLEGRLAKSDEVPEELVRASCA